MYDMLGNHFDADAMLLRIFSLVWTWAAGEELPSPPAPHPPAQILALFQDVTRQVRSHGLEPDVLRPFPSDILDMVVAIDAASAPDWSLHLPHPVVGGHVHGGPNGPPLAAGDGRGAP